MERGVRYLRVFTTRLGHRLLLKAILPSLVTTLAEGAEGPSSRSSFGGRDVLHLQGSTVSTKSKQSSSKKWPKCALALYMQEDGPTPSQRLCSSGLGTSNPSRWCHLSIPEDPLGSSRGHSCQHSRHSHGRRAQVCEPRHPPRHRLRCSLEQILHHCGRQGQACQRSTARTASTAHGRRRSVGGGRGP